MAEPSPTHTLFTIVHLPGHSQPLHSQEYATAVSQSSHPPTNPTPPTASRSSSSSSSRSSSSTVPGPLPSSSTTHSFARTPTFVDLPLDEDSDEFQLVRTAQASRLRRRGAIRIEATSSATTANHTMATGSITGSSGAPSRGGWEVRRVHPYMYEDERERDFELEKRISAEFREVRHAATSGREILCGGFPSSHNRLVSDDESRRPNPLPMSLPTLTLKERRQRLQKIDSPFDVPTGNGCGALVHTSASPSSSLGLWAASRKGLGDEVGPMEEPYFQGEEDNEFGLNSAGGKLGTSPCGCRREGFGCLACGNPLGTVLHLCFSHSFSHTSSASAPILHTFFRTRTHVADPSFTFPTPPATPPVNIHLNAHPNATSPSIANPNPILHLPTPMVQPQQASSILTAPSLNLHGSYMQQYYYHYHHRPTTAAYPSQTQLQPGAQPNGTAIAASRYPRTTRTRDQSFDPDCPELNHNSQPYHHDESPKDSVFEAALR